MAMTHDPTDASTQEARRAPVPAEDAPVATTAEPTLTWAERETLDGLRRLARARAQLAAAEGRPDEGRPRPFDPVAEGELERVHRDLLEARIRATGRFVKGGARARVRELELTERQLLDHLKMATYDDYRARAAALRAPAPTVDPDVVAFARRELESAERGWQELRELNVPAPHPAPVQAPPVDAEPDIDLTAEPVVAERPVAQR